MTASSLVHGGGGPVDDLATTLSPEEAIRLVDLARRLAVAPVGDDLEVDVGSLMDDGERTSKAFLDVAHDLVASARDRADLHARLAARERDRARLLAAVLHAQEEERSRIARDLHDQIGQSLTALLLGLETGKDAGVPGERARLKGLATQALEEVSRIALALRPSLLEALGLEAALRQYARDLATHGGVQVEVTVALPRLSRQVETVLYRVAQEALTNVVRHAHAHAASVVATATSRQVDLVVEDDGMGFDERALEPGMRLGLEGMRERVELVGGTLRVESAPGAGAAVYARIPRRDS